MGHQNVPIPGLSEPCTLLISLGWAVGTRRSRRTPGQAVFSAHIVLPMGPLPDQGRLLRRSREPQPEACFGAQDDFQSPGLTLGPSSRGVQAELEVLATPKGPQSPRRPPPVNSKAGLGSPCGAGPMSRALRKESLGGYGEMGAEPGLPGRCQPYPCTPKVVGDVWGVGKLLVAFKTLRPEAGGARPLFCARLKLLACVLRGAQPKGEKSARQFNAVL